MPRPVLLGIVGDSASGKTTLTRGLVRILGEAQVTHVSADHYHRYDRRQRAENGLTPLNPECNHLDILQQHLHHLRVGEPILRPVYNHGDGTFGPAVYVRPALFTIVDSLLGYHTRELLTAYDVRVYLDPPEELRRKWKVQRDCSRRGYTTDQVLEEIDRREPDAASFIRPQRRYADIVISFIEGIDADAEHLDARISLRPGLVHPDLSPLADGDSGGIAIDERPAETCLFVAGRIDPGYSAAIQEAIWDRMQFASHLRTERLGEFTVGTQLHRSESLAITQLLVLYQVVTARAAVAVGAAGTRTDGVPAAGRRTDGVPVAGMSMDGVPVAGIPADGVPVAGIPADGVPVAGIPADGVPVAGIPADEAPAAKTRTDGVPAAADA